MTALRDPRDVERIAELEGQLVAKDVEIAQLKAEVAGLSEKVAELTELVAKLMAKLGQNSGNSSLPPSSDGPGARAGEKSKGSAKRSRGGQPGHRGSKRELVPLEQVAVFVEMYPAKCENCWVALPQTRDDNAERYQVTEVPPIVPHTTEYRRNAVKCTCCGFTTQAKLGAVPLSPFGPRLMALIGLFVGTYHLSRRRTGELLHDVLGVKISLGALSAIEARVSDAVASSWAQIWAKVTAAAVKHTDATSWLHRHASLAVGCCLFVRDRLQNSAQRQCRPRAPTLRRLHGHSGQRQSHRLFVLAHGQPANLLEPSLAKIRLIF